ncbi:rRNA adenine N-6-methyltransferase family protein [Nonomuraea wenchangensis]
MTRDHAFGDRPSSRTTSRAGGAHTTADRARRTLSQNFLADRQAIALVIRAADPAGLVLEPGAGAGALTLALAGAGAQVIGYEIDPRLARRLAARTRDDPRVEVVHGDFTTAPVPGRPFAVVGNIPYSATSKIVKSWSSLLTLPLKPAVDTDDQRHRHVIADRLTLLPRDGQLLNPVSLLPHAESADADGVVRGFRD